jgi:hypothetical protein
MSILLTCAVAGLAWWLGWQSAKVRIIDTLKERLKIARQQCNDIKTRLSDLKSQVEMQEKLISELLNKSDPTNKRVGELARGNTKIQNTLTDLTTSTGHLFIVVHSKRPRDGYASVLWERALIAGARRSPRIQSPEPTGHKKGGTLVVANGHADSSPASRNNGRRQRLRCPNNSGSARLACVPRL